ncbi:endonuclease/exonuclease/phosphatase family protein [Nodosilinea sp. PGN35]|uniref:endonuclease/exonuclease/phosphatase family protein n=1 Tax=Nodosilinea sp. PGN35 TaxID=3020489 RepID=UPI0023B26B88|nr:endonuclease/exonuclease/phosphatase family protein [Nodosilinea sp. TSF1-S3]MDF0368557.1 endonuclease/exonuclease/phosphatase family protein [Nodosilinea sp. TSF1-S3]
MGASAAPLKIATWNIEHLRASSNSGPNPRTETDYQRLAAYAEQLDADVIALQEVEGAAAAARIFDPEEYAFFFSNQTEPMLTGFAVRRGIDVIQNPDLAELDVGGGDDLRYGADITITRNGRELRLLSIHLKAFCFQNPIDAPSNACMALNQQLTVLENWIDARAAAEVPFLVLGDFNRRLNLLGDQFWFEIDDADPPNADLVNGTAGLLSQCWEGEFPNYIDHIVMDASSSRWLVPDSFEQLLFLEPIAQQDVLSDHCPIAITLDVPAADVPEPALSETQRQLLERLESVERELRELREIILDM